MAEGIEYDGRRRRIRRVKEPNPIVERDGTCTLNRFYTIPHRDNNIKIVVFHIFALRFSL